MTENTINIDEILEELSKLYSLTLDAGRKIVIDTISEEYKSLYPVILEEDGLYAVYEDKKKPNELKYVKLKYSKKKINNIIKNIHKQAIKYYLKQKRKEFTTFIQTKKSYLHAKYSYSIDNKDYYNLYYDLNHKHKVASVNAVFINNKQKKRIYPSERHQTHYKLQCYLCVNLCIRTIDLLVFCYLCTDIFESCHLEENSVCLLVLSVMEEIVIHSNHNMTNF